MINKFAIVLWKYGQFTLTTLEDTSTAAKYLQEATEVFRKVNQKDDLYYQCLSRLGHTYAILAVEKKEKLYKNEAEKILKELSDNVHKINKKYKCFIKKLQNEIANIVI